MAAELTFWLKDLGFCESQRVKRLMQISIGKPFIENLKQQ
jgi:hypothetical protein